MALWVTAQTGRHWAHNRPQRHTITADRGSDRVVTHVQTSKLRESAEFRISEFILLVRVVFGRLARHGPEATLACVPYPWHEVEAGQPGARVRGPR